jgi:hypothetical protein
VRLGLQLNNQAIFHCSIEGTSGTVAATVELYGSMDDTIQSSIANAAKSLLATFSLSGTGAGAGISAASDVWPVAVPYKYFWGKVTAISGTGAQVSLWAGV